MERSRTGFGPIALSAAFALGALAGGAFVAARRADPPDVAAVEQVPQIPRVPPTPRRRAEPPESVATEPVDERPSSPRALPDRVIVDDETRLPAAAAAHVRRLREDPALEPYRFVVRWAPPFLVALQFEAFTADDELHKNRDRLANARSNADVEAALLSEAHGQLLRMLGSRCGLPDLRDAGQAFLAIVASTRDDQRLLYRIAAGEEFPDWAGVLYSTSARTLFLRAGIETLTSQDELLAAGGRLQKRSYSDALHEATILLLHEHRRLRRGADDAEGAPRAFWFEEGFAELVAGFEVPQDAKRDVTGPDVARLRLNLAQIMTVVGQGNGGNLRAPAREWTVTDLLAVSDEAELFRRAARKQPTNALQPALLFVARAWGFVHFLWHYDGGEYRARLLDVADAVLDGTATPERVAALLGISTDADRERLEAEFEWYWDRVLARRAGRKPSGSPWLPATDPPTGRR